MSAVDPFAIFDTSPPESPPPVVESGIAVPNGSVFVYDLETVPDESRNPRPVPVERPLKPDAPVDVEKLQQQTVAAIREKIPVLSIAQLMKLGNIEMAAQKPRQGVKDAVSEQLSIETSSGHEQQMAEWLKLGFNPLGCRIVALGIKSAKHRVTMLAKDNDEERELLRVLWLHIQRFQTRCGYNITGFDDSVLIARSMILGIEAPERISRKKFGDRGSIDLMVALFPNSPAQKLKEVCRLLGIVPPAGYEMSGDKVFQLVEEGRWDDIAAYVSSDADIEFELYSRLSEYQLF